MIAQVDLYAMSSFFISGFIPFITKFINCSNLIQSFPVIEDYIRQKNSELIFSQRLIKQLLSFSNFKTIPSYYFQIPYKLFNSIITQMGQSQTLAHKEPVTFQQVQKSIKTIFDDQQTKFQPIDIAIPIQQILQNLSEFIPAQKTQEGFVLNHKMIQIFYHKTFLYSMGKLINLLIDKLEQIGQKTLIMVQKDEWMFCLNLANFITFFTDDKLIRMMETVNIRSDLSQNTQKFIQKLQKQGQQFAATQSLIDKLSFSQIERIQKCLRISINQMISMKTNVITRSEKTLKIIQKLEQACFILYLKALYSPQHSQSILNKAKHPEFLRSNLTIAHYFLGKGADLVIPSIYESAVLFMSNLIQKNKANLRELKSLPTHLFKTLPIVNQNTIYDFVTNVCLYSLTYVKDLNGNFYSRFSFNRIMTLKLLDLMVKEVKITSKQITYYLEEICLQTRIGMIERSFVTDLVQHYMDVVHELLNNNNNKSDRLKPQSQQKIQPSNSQKTLKIIKLSRQNHLSQILTKYLEGGKENYNIKYSNKKYKISTADIVTELENDQNIIQNQFRIICQKYIYEVVLGKRVIYQVNDKQIWNQILPHILQDKCNSSGDQYEAQGNEPAQNYHKPQMKRQENSNLKQKQISKFNNQTNSQRQAQQLRPSSIKVNTSEIRQIATIQPQKDAQDKQPSQKDEEFEDISEHEDQDEKEQPVEATN